MSTSAFMDNDNGYRQWFLTHPQGYVLNVDRKFWLGTSISDPLSFHIHRANSGCVTTLRKGAEYLTKEYIKVCSPDLEELETLQKSGRTVQKCGNCFRH